LFLRTASLGYYITLNEKGTIMKKFLLTMFAVVFLLIIIWFLLFLMTKEPQQAAYYRLPSNPPGSENVLTNQEALQDYYFFKDALENNHPALYHFVSKDSLEEMFFKIKQVLEEQSKVTIGELYLSLKEITGAIDDIHTNVYAPVYKNEKIIPLTVQLIGEDLYVTEVLPPVSIPIGSQLISIDASPIQDIIKKVSIYSNTPLISGTNVFVQDSLMRLFPRLMNTKESCVVEYSFEGHLIKQEIPLIVLQENQGQNNAHENIITQYVFQKNDLKIPVLEINRFSGTDFNDYKKVVDSFFEEYANTENIVIDIRHNSGGSTSWGNYVLNYFAPDQYKTHDRFEYLISDHAKEKLGYEFHRRLYYKKIPSLFWDTPLYKIIPGVQALGRVMHSENGERFSEHPLYTKNTLKENERYQVHVFLLIGERTGSAAIDFASAFKYNEMGTVVGRETYHPDSFSGNITYHTLPNSSLFFANAVTYSIAARGEDDGKGVVPDYWVDYSLEDYLENTDKDLETVLKLVN